MRSVVVMATMTILDDCTYCDIGLITVMEQAASVGAALLALVYALGHISGANLNPAVSLW